MKVKARSGCARFVKLGAEALLHNIQGRDEKEGCELSVRSLGGRVSRRADILNFRSEDY